MISRSTPMPQPARRRHRVPQRVEEVLVELHRLRVAAGGPQRLLGQPPALLHRVDRAPSRRCPARRRTRPGPTARPAADRTGARGSVARSPPGSRCRRSASSCAARPARRTAPTTTAPAVAAPVDVRRRRPADRQDVVPRWSTVTVVPVARLTASCTVIDRPRPGQVDRRRAAAASGRCATGAPCTATAAARISSRVSSRMSCSRRRPGTPRASELGVVGGVGALVAEVPADLEDPLDAADRQPLEVQLGRDPQVESSS